MKGRLVTVNNASQEEFVCKVQNLRGCSLVFSVASDLSPTNFTMGNIVSSTFEYFFGTSRDTSTGNSSETSTRHSTGDSSRYSNDSTGDTSTRRSSNYTSSYPSSIYVRETTTYPTNPSNSYVRETTAYPNNPTRYPSISPRRETPTFLLDSRPSRSEERKVVFYHYTDSWGVLAIKCSGYIKESTEDSQYAHFGRGVYGTSMAPSAGKMAIAKNNWTRGGHANRRRGRVDYAIRLEIPQSKVKTCPNRYRDLLLHKGQINLSDYDWSVVSVPDNSFDDFY